MQARYTLLSRLVTVKMSVAGGGVGVFLRCVRFRLGPSLRDRCPSDKDFKKEQERGRGDPDPTIRHPESAVCVLQRFADARIKCLAVLAGGEWLVGREGFEAEVQGKRGAGAQAVGDVLVDGG